LKTYHNLTQCKRGKLVYFRSTDIEQKNWERLLWSVPDEWLYLLSKGKKIKVVDRSTKVKGKIERIFIPVLVDFLNKLYHDLPPKNKWLSYHYKKAVDTWKHNPSLYTKFKFWQGVITKEVKIIGATKQVMREVNFK